MSISNLNITQDNVYNGSNLLPIHSDLAFLVDADYFGAPPEYILVDIVIDGGVASTYRLIPFKDPFATTRTFCFKAGVIRGLMGEFDDEQQLNESVIFLEQRSTNVTLTFYDPDNDSTNVSKDFTMLHGANQFGQYPNKDAVFNNEHDTYLCPTDGFTYVYFYNDDESNVITIGDSGLSVVYAEDYEDSVFTDYEDSPFLINIPL